MRGREGDAQAGRAPRHGGIADRGDEEPAFLQGGGGSEGGFVFAEDEGDDGTGCARLEGFAMGAEDRTEFLSPRPTDEIESIADRRGEGGRGRGRIDEAAGATLRMRRVTAARTM